MQISELHKLFINSAGVCTDTRNIVKNSLFFALKGANFNGNQYAKDAIKNGASYAIIDEPKFKTSDKTILVDSVLETLQNLANYHRKTFTIPFIGITGSNGKTTNKELIHAVLSQKYKVHATKGNLNNHLGVPFTLLSIPNDTEIAIIEMGANHLKEIEELCNIAEPTHGLITNIGKAHLEGFGSIEGIIKTKSELYDACKRVQGPIFQNIDNPILAAQSKNYFNVVGFSTKTESENKGTVLTNNPFLQIACNGITYKTNLIGEYNLENILAAITIGKYFNVPETQIQIALANYFPNNNRSQLTKLDSNTLILDAYNANPTSMKHAIESFAKMDFTNKVLVLGDMLELGENSKTEHQDIADLCKALNFEQVFLVGTEFEKCDTNYQKFKTCDALKTAQPIAEIKNSAILIKGSRGIKLEGWII